MDMDTLTLLTSYLTKFVSKDISTYITPEKKIISSAYRLSHRPLRIGRIYLSIERESRDSVLLRIRQQFISMAETMDGNRL